MVSCGFRSLMANTPPASQSAFPRPADFFVCRSSLLNYQADLPIRK
jgi:hypothetical protein